MSPREQRTRTTGRVDRHGAHGVGAGRLAHRMRLPAHTASGSVLRTWYPWIMDPGFGVPGAYIGVDLFSRASFLFDPWELYAAGVITSPNIVLIGEIGSGKSALLKSLIARFAAVGVPFSWVDVKGEYTDLAAALGVTPLRLGPGLGVRLNPLAAHQHHPGQSEEEWLGALKARRLALLEGLLHVRIGRPLSVTERTAVELALDACTGQLPGAARDRLAPASLPGVAAELTRIEQWSDALRERGVSAAELMGDTRDVRLALHGLVDGALAEMFDGTGDNARYLDWDAPGTVLSLEAVRSDHAVTVMSMVCAQSAMEAELLRTDARRRLVGYDEAWLAMRYLPLLQRLQTQFKLSRAYGTTNVLAGHRFTDFDSVGNAGSEAARLARGLLEDTGITIVYRQTDAAVPTTRDLLGLTDVQAGLLRHLRKGSGLWRVGTRAFVVQHLLSSVEEPLVQTDSRMHTPTEHPVDDAEWDALLDEAAP
jgi:type IV secretory pathway VirB4 component